MRDNVVPIRSKAVDSEKITINLGYVDLGQIDLLVQEGFYSNRTDFIRTAIRNQLQRHAEVVNASTVRKSLDLGLRHYTRAQLEAAQRDGKVIEINVLGLATIASDVPPELARATIRSVTVLGALQASPEVKAALADKNSAERLPSDQSVIQKSSGSEGDYGRHDAPCHALDACTPADRSHGTHSERASWRH